MENPDQDMLLIQSVMRPKSTGNDNTQPASNQVTPEPRCGPQTLALIKFRIQQLHNRRFLLLKIQHFKKAEDNSGRTTEEMICEDSDELCELQAIQKELEELLVKKETMEKEEKSTSLTENEGQQNTFYNSETPCGGIYMLPPPLLTQEDTRPAVEIPTGLITPVDSLGQMPAVTRCPSCDEVVSTVTRRTVGKAMWTLCCLCCSMGCVAGCCLIPFLVDHLKTVQHQCPQCQAHIHTYQPF